MIRSIYILPVVYNKQEITSITYIYPASLERDRDEREREREREIRLRLRLLVWRGESYDSIITKNHFIEL